MRNNLPKYWVEAAMMTVKSEAVMDVFDELDVKWKAFMAKFDIWAGSTTPMNRLDQIRDEEILKPLSVWDRVMVEMNADMDKLTTWSEEQPEHIDKWLKWWIGR